MADCLHEASCQCYMRNGAGTTVTGTGAEGNDFVVSGQFYDPTSANLGVCGQAAQCMGAHLGTGLVYDPATGRIRVRISEASGNTVTVESDGLYSPQSATACGRTVADILPPTAGRTAGDIVMGDRGYGVNGFPQGLLRSCRAAVDLELDGVQLDIDGLADGTPYLRNCYLGTDQLDNWCITGGYDGSLSDPAVDLNWSDLTTQSARNLVLAVNNWYRQGTHRWPAGVWPGEQGRVTTGPYYGKFAGLPQIGINTVAQLLGETGRSMVYVYALGLTTDTRPDVATKLVATILRACTQSSSVVASRNIANLTAASQAGIQTGYLARSQADADAVSAATLLGNGVDWVFADWRIPASSLAPFVTAGLRVVINGAVQRRTHRAQVAANGYAGVVSTDPAYYRRDAMVGYASMPVMTRDTWAMGAFTEGQLAPLAEDDTSALWRGQSTMGDPGSLGYPPYCAVPADPKPYVGWRPETSFETSADYGTTWGRVTTVLGWASPVADPNSYTVAWSHLWNSIPAGAAARAEPNGLGLAFALPDDRDLRDTTWDRDYFTALQTASGRLVVTMYRTGQAPVTAMSAAGVLVSAATWYHFRVTVTPAVGVVMEQFPLPAWGINGAQSATASTPALAGGPRGGYVALHKRQDPADRASGSWANFEWKKV